MNNEYHPRWTDRRFLGNFRKGKGLEAIYRQAATETQQHIVFGEATYDPDNYFGLYSNERDLSRFWARVMELRTEQEAQ
jgi:hypothetical protein